MVHVLELMSQLQNYVCETYSLSHSMKSMQVLVVLLATVLIPFPRALSLLTHHEHCTYPLGC